MWNPENFTKVLIWYVANCYRTCYQVYKLAYKASQLLAVAFQCIFCCYCSAEMTELFAQAGL